MATSPTTDAFLGLQKFSDQDIGKAAPQSQQSQHRCRDMRSCRKTIVVALLVFSAIAAVVLALGFALAIAAVINVTKVVIIAGVVAAAVSAAALTAGILLAAEPAPEPPKPDNPAMDKTPDVKHSTEDAKEEETYVQNHESIRNRHSNELKALEEEHERTLQFLARKKVMDFEKLKRLGGCSSGPKKATRNSTCLFDLEDKFEQEYILKITKTMNTWYNNEVENENARFEKQKQDLLERHEKEKLESRGNCKTRFGGQN